jgi:hypothetical protein
MVKLRSQRMLTTREGKGDGVGYVDVVRFFKSGRRRARNVAMMPEKELFSRLRRISDQDVGGNITMLTDISRLLANPLENPNKLASRSSTSALAVDFWNRYHL